MFYSKNQPACFICLLLIFLFWADLCAEPIARITAEKKRLIEELVLLTGEIGPFREQVRRHYHEELFVPTEKMFKGTLLENDPHARDIMNNAIDSVLAHQFDSAAGLKNVHHQSFAPHFDEQELIGVIEFYRTPAGKKAFSTMGNLFEQWKNNRNQWALSLRAEIRQAIKEQLDAYYKNKLGTVSGRQ